MAVDVEPEGAVNEFLAEFTRWEKERERTAKRPEITADDREFVERQRKALRTFRTLLIIAAIGMLGALLYLALVWWPHRH